MDNASIGAAVKEARTCAHLSQQEVSIKMKEEHSSWHQTVVSKVEQGIKTLRYAEAVSLARILGVPVGWFAGEFGNADTTLADSALLNVMEAIAKERSALHSRR